MIIVIYILINLPPMSSLVEFTIAAVGVSGYRTISRQPIELHSYPEVSRQKAWEMKMPQEGAFSIC